MRQAALQETHAGPANNPLYTGSAVDLEVLTQIHVIAMKGNYILDESCKILYS